MKKVLVTGAAGSIGINVLKYLVQREYDVTAFDIKNYKNSHKLAPYKKQVKIVYGDVNDRLLLEALIRDTDVVIHLAGIIAPFANLKGDLCRIVDFEGTCNVVNAINSFNPKCYLVYSSSTSLYEDKKLVSASSPIDFPSEDFYSKYKYESEKTIQKALKNYTIFRLPIVMCNPSDDKPIYNVAINSKVELVSNIDVGYALAETISHQTSLNKKIYNLTGGKENYTIFKDYVLKILEIYGITWQYLLTLLLMEKNYRCHKYSDGDKLDEILKFRSESLEEYYVRLAEYGHKRIISKILAKPFIYLLKNKK